MSEKSKEKQYLYYKGKPLVRCGDTIYYGSMADKYVIELKVLTTKKVKDLEVADKVQIQLKYTDPDLRTRDKVVKQSERRGLYNAMDIGSIWLERALNEK